jgi:hypothetical protein
MVDPYECKVNILEVARRRQEVFPTPDRASIRLFLAFRHKKITRSVVGCCADFNHLQPSSPQHTTRTLSRPRGQKILLDEGVEVAVEDCVDIPHLQISAMVFDQPVGM